MITLLVGLLNNSSNNTNGTHRIDSILQASLKSAVPFLEVRTN